MGGPNNLNEVELFLSNMFHDKNILTISNSFFRSLLAKWIVHSRLKHAQSNYTALGGKSPIVDHTQKLIDALNKQDPDSFYTFAMSYTPPFIKDVFIELQQKNITEVLLFSLYPQYSTTTTLTSLERVDQACKELSYHPRITIIDRYYDNPLYNYAIVDKIQEKLGIMPVPSTEVTLIFSAHGLPQKIIDKGDPYKQEVLKNIDHIKTIFTQNSIKFKNILHAFQSHLGPVKWTKPFLSEVLDDLKGESVLIYPIAFTIDNSETDFELSIEYKEYANNIGIKHYEVCSCLNDSPLFINSILNLSQSSIKEGE